MSHLGIYVDSASLVLKISERTSNKDCMKTSTTGPINSNRLSFIPYLKFDFSGVFQEIKSIGVHTVNVCGGISGVHVTPMAKCSCGIQDTLEESDHEKKEEKTAMEDHFIECGNHEQKSYLRGSLFQKDIGDEDGTCKERKCSYEFDWDGHLQGCTEEKMLARSSAVALDMLYHLDLPDDFDSEHLSVFSDLENSEMEEKSICRIVFGPSKVVFNSSSVHRLSSTMHYLAKYDYAPYAQDITEDDLELSTNKSQETLPSENVSNKIRIYQITAISPSVRISSADHLNLKEKDWESMKLRECEDAQVKIFSAKNGGPDLVINVDCIDAQFVVPMYPLKLVSQAKKDANLIKKCNSTLNLKLMHCSSRIVTNDDQGVTWFQPSNFEMKMSSLLLPNLSSWSNDVPRWHLNLQIESCKLRLSRPQSMVLRYIQSTWMVRDPSEVKSHPTVVQDAMTRKLPSLTILLSKWCGQVALSKTSLTVQSYCNEVGVMMSNVSNSLPILSTVSPTNSLNISKTFSMNVSPGRAQNRSLEEGKSHHWLKLDLQFPLSPEHSHDVLSMFALQIGEVDINFDPKVYEWLTYKAASSSDSLRKPGSKKPVQDRDLQDSKSLKVPSLMNKSRTRSKSPKSEHSKKKKGIVPMKSISALTDLKSSIVSKSRNQPNNGSFIKDFFGARLHYWYATMRAILIQVQIESCRIYIPKRSLAFANVKPMRKVRDAIANIGSKIPLIAINCPSMIFENVAHKPMILQFLNQVPIRMPESVWNPLRDNLPWTLKLKDFSLFTLGSDGGKIPVLEPITTSCTIGISGKDEGINVAIHADMSPLRVAINENQLGQIVHTAEKLMFVASQVSSMMQDQPSQKVS